MRRTAATRATPRKPARSPPRDSAPAARFAGRPTAPATAPRLPPPLRLLPLPDATAPPPPPPPHAAAQDIAASYLRRMRVACAAFAVRPAEAAEAAPMSPGAAAAPGAALCRCVSDTHAWLFGTAKSRHAWPALFSRRNRPWRTFVAVLSSELIARDTDAAAAVLTLLYNVLRYMRPARRRRVVRHCCRAGLAQQCVVLLLAYESVVAAAVSPFCPALVPSSTAGCSAQLRVVEGAALVLGLCAAESPKVMRLARRTQSIAVLLRDAQQLLVLVERRLAAVPRSVAPPPPPPPLRSPLHRSHSNLNASSHSPSSPVHYSSRSSSASSSSSSPSLLMAPMQPQLPSIAEAAQHACSALLHVIVALHNLSASQLNARTQGAQCVALVVQTAWFAHAQLSRLGFGPAPLRLTLEMLLEWSAELLRRLCDLRRGAKPALDRARQEGAVAMLFALATHPAERIGVSLSALHTLNALTARDTVCRAQLRENLGGHAALVRGVLAASATRSAVQWHRLYIGIAALLGVATLPGEFSYVRGVRVIQGVRTLNGEDDVSIPLVDESNGKTGNNGKDIIKSSHTDSTETGVAEPMLVDSEPRVFSPELRGAYGRALADGDVRLAAFAPPGEMPFVFTAEWPPVLLSRVAQNVLDDIPPPQRGSRPEPLLPPTAEARVRVMRRLVERLGATETGTRKRIVYERPPPRQRAIGGLSHCQGQSNGGGGGDSSSSGTESGGSIRNGSFVMEQSSSGYQMGSRSSNMGAIRGAVQVPEGELVFQSDFEGGNLQRAVAVAENEYDLVLSPDTNTNCHMQWFYFSVESYVPGETYHFNILNMEKPSSTFNEGQRPLMLFVADEPIDSNVQEQTETEWVRCGHDICYYPNPYHRPTRCTTTAHKSRDVAEEPTVPAERSNQKPVSSAKKGNPQKPSTVPRRGANNVSTTTTTKTAASKRKFSLRTSLQPTLPAPPATAPAPPAPAKKRVDPPASSASFYYSLSFSVTFPVSSGRVFLANCFPYTYSCLIRDLRQWQELVGPSVFLAVQQLCRTPGGLALPLITLTSADDNDDKDNDNTDDVTNHNNVITNDVHSNGSNTKNDCGDGEGGNETMAVAATAAMELRPVCFVTARVHPGESNSNWMLRGVMSRLLAPDARGESLRKRFVWKIVPMLNPDGVVLGNHRCSLGGADLNRDYSDPNPQRNPAIYSLKKLVRHIMDQEQRRVVFFADMHGHSRAKNFLIYGCATPPIATPSSPKQPVPPAATNGNDRERGAARPKLSIGSPSTRCATAALPLLPLEKLLPLLLGGLSPAFAMSQCAFSVQKSKRHTGRVVMYRHLGIRMSYTVEATMMGGRDDTVPAIPCDPTPPAEVHYTPSHYERMGALLVRGVAVLASNGTVDAGIDTTDRDAMDAAWVALPSTSDGANLSPSSPLLSLNVNGTYVLATRPERRAVTGRRKVVAGVGAAAAAAAAPLSIGAFAVSSLSAEQRMELLRALFARPRGTATGAAAGGSVQSSSSSDAGESDDEDEDDKRRSEKDIRGADTERNEDDDDDDEDDDEDDDDDDDDEDDEEDAESTNDEVDNN